METSTDTRENRGAFRVSSIRIPPQDIEAEKALIGSIMTSPNALYDVIDMIRPETFYVGKHAIIWKAMLELFGKSEPIDLLSVSSKLKERDLLEQIGGSSYLAEITGSVPAASHAEYYATIVQKKSILRALIARAEYLADLGYQEGEDLESSLEKAEKAIFEVTNFSGKQKFIHLKETLTEAWERLDRLHKSSDATRGVKSGFPDIDNKLSGFQNSDLIILAARPSVGKTSLALDFARNAAVHGKVPVGVFSLEMSSHQLVDRMLSAESRVDSWKLRTGKLSTDLEFSMIQEALNTLSQAPLYIDDDSSNTLMRMRSVARRMKAEHGLGLIVVDYLQLIVPGRNFDSMVQQVTEISRGLKGMARELDVPVIALSQLSRAVEQRGGEPRLSDLRDSGSIEQDADVVMFIHREDKYDKESTRPNIAKIIIAKHRNGPTGEVDLFFDDKRTSFASIEKNDFGGF
ncbi:MAG: replicative DNA helicase [Patescibacteria group bacterium]